MDFWVLRITVISEKLYLILLEFSWKWVMYILLLVNIILEFFWKYKLHYNHAVFI